MRVCVHVHKYSSIEGEGNWLMIQEKVVNTVLGKSFDRRIVIVVAVVLFCILSE